MRRGGCAVSSNPRRPPARAPERVIRTAGDMHIFEHWHLSKEPVLLIGMDTLGLLDVFIIDYRRRELQFSMHEQRN